MWLSQLALESCLHIFGPYYSRFTTAPLGLKIKFFLIRCCCNGGGDSRVAQTFVDLFEMQLVYLDSVSVCEKE